MLAHETAWSVVRPALEQHFTVHSIARRGRGESTKTTGHSVDDEAQDIAEVVDGIGGGVYLLGHSYGAVCSLEASMRSRAVERLILYEPPKSPGMPAPVLHRIEEMAQAAEWSRVAETFLADVLQIPAAAVDAMKQSPIWIGMVSDAEASLEDWRAFAKYEPETERFRGVTVPVLFLTGSESPDELYQTDELARVLPDCRKAVLEGQAHGAMLTGADLFVREIEKFLLHG
jgi:pimeloyl-ACP methyl ester carboxylesterase